MPAGNVFDLCYRTTGIVHLNFDLTLCRLTHQFKYLSHKNDQIDDIEYLVSEHQHSGPGVHSYVIRELTVRHKNPTKWSDKRQASLVLIETETEHLYVVLNFLFGSNSKEINSNLFLHSTKKL